MRTRTATASSSDVRALPILALAALSTGYAAPITRAEIRDTLRSPFVLAARGRGLPPWRVVGVHALRPALTPVLTFVAANPGQLVVGLVVMVANTVADVAAAAVDPRIRLHPAT